MDRHRTAAHVPAPTPKPRRALLKARREITERCLYGVDKNPLAVEMAKLSLWLITLAKDRPFSFVDHALRAGDSLLGVTDLKQLRIAHLDPSWHRQASLDLGFDEIEAAVDRALELRHELEAFVVNDVLDAERKAAMLAQADAALDDALLLGDLVVGTALAQLDDADPLASADVARNIRTMVDHEAPELERMVARTQLRTLAETWLVETRRAVGEVPEVVWADRDPFHWALEFPEVRGRGGFDAIVGNPPFQGGQKITGSLGGLYRDYLVEWLAGGARGSADLVAYFYMRAATLLRPSGGFGLIATNTLAEGATREVGLDQLAAAGWTIHRAVSSEPWPGGANLEMATVWAQLKNWNGLTILDRASVGGISSSLTPCSRVVGRPYRLYANRDCSFTGTTVLGQGFVLSGGEAKKLLDADSRNSDVVRPYLIGRDLNQRPDGSPSRWVINFRDWPEDHARGYAAPFARVEQLVRPERETNNRELYRRVWWQFAERRPGLYRTLASVGRCIAIAQVSNIAQPMFVPADIVLDQQVVVFAYDDDTRFGLLASGIHWWWIVVHGSKHETRIRYTPSDCFETFPQPELTGPIGTLSSELHTHRSALMLDRQEGLTKTYNRLHDADEHADDIDRLRAIHTELDRAVRDSYGWTDLDLGHGFHETKFGSRFTLAPGPRQEVLDRLLELNHERYAQEVAQGLHGKPKSPVAAAPAVLRDSTAVFADSHAGGAESSLLAARRLPRYR